jgi:hypothetical protein
MNTDTLSELVEAWLAKLSTQNEPVVTALRTLVRSVVPNAHEIVYHDALGYGPSDSGFDRILYVAAFGTHVNLGFFYGGLVQDTEGLLLGSGKRMRHIKIRSPQECTNPALSRLLDQAWAVGLQCVAQRHGG